MSLQKDLNAAALGALCQKIQMPQPAAEKVAALAQSYDFTAAEAYYPGLFSVETGDQAVQGLRALLAPDEEDGMLMLTVMLAGALNTGERCRKLGIPEKVWLDTMGCFSRFVRENFESEGVYSFDRDFWAYRQLSMVLFRIGALEYEMRALEGAVQAGGLTLLEGTPILSIHIPSDAVLTRESLDESYGAAKVFFARHFPEFHYRCGWCHSWIISPNLQKLLPDTSKILTFQGDFIITKVDENAEGYKFWLFKTKDSNMADYREDTSLQRRAKAHLLAGGKIGEAAGILKPGLL